MLSVIVHPAAGMRSTSTVPLPW